MAENAVLSGSISQIDLDFVEREATPRLLMKLSIQLHLVDLSLSDTISIRVVFGVRRARSPVHNWVHKADLQPDDGQSPDHIAVDETMIRRNDEQYWLYTAVDPETNELLHTSLEPTRNNVIAQSFVRELTTQHNIDDAIVILDGAASLQNACSRHGLQFRDERHGDRNSVERVFREVKRRTSSFPNCFSNASTETADEWLRSFAFAWNQRI
jgi:putative transposase